MDENQGLRGVALPEFPDPIVSARREGVLGRENQPERLR